MSDLRALDLVEVISDAQSALSAAGKPARIRDTQVLSHEDRRNLIVRACAEFSDGRTQSVIVKATRAPDYDPRAEDAFETSGLIKEWVATALLASRKPAFRHGSRLLAGSVGHGLLVFEDLGADLGSLVDPLLEGSADDAERSLKSYALALARLHADTVGCLAAHHEVFESIFGTGRGRPQLGWQVERHAERAAKRLGGNPPTDELAQLSRRLGDPGAWLTLTHGDPCPDNALLVADGIGLIDYEFARPSHALLDAIYWRMGFPTCWCAGRVPPQVGRRIDAVYRQEIGKTIPLALDDEAYRTEMAFAAMIWLFRRLDRLLEGALEEDREWGIGSVRSRLLWYLEIAAELAGDAGVLPGIKAVAEAWLSELRNRWPDAKTLGLYPAFAAAGSPSG
jgi:hypothetical protein